MPDPKFWRKVPTGYEMKSDVHFVLSSSSLEMGSNVSLADGNNSLSLSPLSLSPLSLSLSLSLYEPIEDLWYCKIFKEDF